MPTLEEVEAALKASWGKDTCFPTLADNWTKENPAYGQCAVTALVVQDYFGGELPWCDHQFHFWNRLPDGKEVDYTRSQFSSNVTICEDKIEPRQYLFDSSDQFGAKTPERYELLSRRVSEKLSYSK